MVDMKNNDLMDPNKIYEDFMHGFVTQSSMIAKFIVFIEFSNLNHIRAECIKILSKLDIKDDKIFELIKQVSLSDEDEAVRSAAVSFIAKMYKDECTDILKYIIQHENSVRVIRAVFFGLGFLSTTKSKIILDKILEKYSQSCRVVKKEIPFFIDSDFRNVRQEPYNFYDKIYLYGTSKLYEISHLYDNGGEYIYALRKNRVIGVRCKKTNFFGYDGKISNSIRYLSKLQILNARDAGLKHVPYGIRYLHRLRHIDLSGNELKTIPNFIGNIPSLTYLNLNKNPLKSLPNSLFSLSKRAYAPKYISEGVHPNEAPVLGMMEMLCGKRLHNWENFLTYCEDADSRHKYYFYYGAYFYYKLNNKGHIIGINMHPDGLNDNECWFTVIPKQVSLLKYIRSDDNNFKVPQYST